MYPAGRAIASKFAEDARGNVMVLSILLVGFVILGLFLSMLSSRPRTDIDDSVTFLPHPEENLPQEPSADVAAEAVLAPAETVHA